MFVFGLAVWFVSFPLLATTQVSTQIYDIDYGTVDQDTLVLLNTGHVAKVPKGKSEILDRLTPSGIVAQNYKFTLDDERNIVAVEEIETPQSKEAFLPEMAFDNAPYVPTTIASMDLAKKYFSEQRYNPKESQCFNRAMVWVYEMWRNHSVKSNKILVFFTKNYIRQYNFEWWFHISPFVHVMENGKVVERVMDKKYTRGPLAFKDWTDIFLQKDPACPLITKFSEYADSPYKGECMIIRTYMYTYQPADLQMNEAWGYNKDKFIMDEVKGAYLEAFDETISK